MEPSKTIAQGSVSLRQVFAAIGILVGLAITVPLIGILMIPGVAIASWARALAADAGAGAPGERRRAAAGASSAAGRRPTTCALGAS